MKSVSIFIFAAVACGFAGLLSSAANAGELAVAYANLNGRPGQTDVGIGSGFSVYEAQTNAVNNCQSRVLADTGFYQPCTFFFSTSDVCVALAYDTRGIFYAASGQNLPQAQQTVINNCYNAAGYGQCTPSIFSCQAFQPPYTPPYYPPQAHCTTVSNSGHAYYGNSPGQSQAACENFEGAQACVFQGSTHCN